MNRWLHDFTQTNCFTKNLRSRCAQFPIQEGVFTSQSSPESKKLNPNKQTKNKLIELNGHGKKPEKANTDLGVIEGISPACVVNCHKTSDPDKLDGRSKVPAGTAAKKTHTSQGVTVSRFIAGTKKQYSAVKAIAIATQLNNGLAYKVSGDESVALCVAGHWVRLSDLEGDHAFPESHIIYRFFRLFPQKKKWERSTSFGFLPEIYRAVLNDGAVKPNKVFLYAHLFDSKNIMGLCSQCNQKKEISTFLGFFHKNYLVKNLLKPYFH